MGDRASRQADRANREGLVAHHGADRHVCLHRLDFATMSGADRQAPRLLDQERAYIRCRSDNEECRLRGRVHCQGVKMSCGEPVVAERWPGSCQMAAMTFIVGPSDSLNDF